MTDALVGFSGGVAYLAPSFSWATSLAGATQTYASVRICSISFQSTLRSSRTPIQPRCPTYAGT